MVPDQLEQNILTMSNVTQKVVPLPLLEHRPFTIDLHHQYHLNLGACITGKTPLKSIPEGFSNMAADWLVVLPVNQSEALWMFDFNMDFS